MRQQTTWNSGAGWLAVLWLVIVLLAAGTAAVLPLPYPPDTPDLEAIAQPPFESSHWLGTDPLGRDVLAGLISGARTACLVSIPAAVLATLLGALLGSVAGYWGNRRFRLSAEVLFVLTGTVLTRLSFTANGPWRFVWLLFALGFFGLLARLLGITRRLAPQAVPLDAAILLLIATLTSVPRLILVLAVAAVQPPSLPNLLVLLACTYWPGTAQLVRAEMQRLRQLPYMEAAQALGLPQWRIIGWHALPGLWRTLRATLPLSIATLIGLETTLSFLGVGLPPEIASWGRLLATARLDLTAWWLLVFPTTVLLLTTLALRQLTFLLSTDYTNPK